MDGTKILTLLIVMVDLMQSPPFQIVHFVVYITPQWAGSHLSISIVVTIMNAPLFNLILHPLKLHQLVSP